MIGTSSHAPWALLARHFFQAFFRLSFLDDAGEESFKRAISGILAAIVAFGFLLARVYFAKYWALAGQPTPDLYRLMLPADQLLMICLQMFAVAFVMALVSHSLFPDDIDFRILMALPVSRRSVFGAKLAALVLFAGIFVLGATLGLGLPFSVASSGQWAGRSLAVRAVAQIATGTFASVFVVACIIAFQGLIVLFTPRAWLRRASIVTQTALICALVLSIPIVVRVPTLAPYLQSQPAWLYAVPPAWFLGVQQWLLGSRDPYFTGLGVAAIIGTMAVTSIGGGCYLVLYRRFDQVVLRTESANAPWAWNVRLSSPLRKHPAYRAVQAFVSATLRRSGLHQLVFAGLFVAGFALSLNRLLGSIGLSERWLILAASGAPLTLMVATVVGLRAALTLPANLRAAWIFQFTEDRASRHHQLNAIRHIVIGIGVIAPALLAFPVLAGVLGGRTAIACFPIVILLGCILVEIAFGHCRRIPFTCTVLFGKRPVAFTLGLAFVAFNVFVGLGTACLRVASGGRTPWLVVLTILLMVGGALRWVRLQTWGRLPLEFEDYLPDAPSTLGLR